ncbi:hypothetical protein D7V80_12270 [Corallococcus sp. CA054B]|nr:hypothetical protein D7V80_12270 [Corallococcus sp. CA054B]
MVAWGKYFPGALESQTLIGYGFPFHSASLASCSGPALFDRSMCPSGALDGLEASGAYEVRRLATTSPYPLGFTLRLPSDGGVGQSDGTPLLFQDVGDGARGRPRA